MKKTPLLILALYPFLLVAQVGDVAKNAVYPYNMAVQSERMEATLVERMVLVGNKPIKMNPLPDLVVQTTPEGYSLSLASPYNPLLQVHFKIFPTRAFKELDANVMLAYLTQLQQKAPPEANFEILLEPFENTGIAELRYLSSLPYVLRYAYTQYNDQGQGTRIICQEAWSEIDDHCYVVIVQAPERAFPNFYEAVRPSIASMYFAD